MKNSLVIYPNFRLRKKTNYIMYKNPIVGCLKDNLIYYMNKLNGIGMASNQLGCFYNLIILQCKTKDLVLINPKILGFSRKKAISDEGCLSIKYFYSKILRYKKTKISYTNLLGKRKKLVCKNLYSFCIQHEIDHLNGILFIDHLNFYEFHSFLKTYLFYDDVKYGLKTC